MKEMEESDPSHLTRRQRRPAPLKMDGTLSQAEYYYTILVEMTGHSIFSNQRHVNDSMPKRATKCQRQTVITTPGYANYEGLTID